MIDEYEKRTKSTISEESDIMTRFKVLSAEIYKQHVQADFVLTQMFANTATGDYLDMHAERRGLERKKALKAKGKVTFYADTPLAENITISKGTVVSTSLGEALSFETDEDAIMLKNSSSVEIDVTAVISGRLSNVVEGAVCVIVTPVAGITRVSNKKAMSGGEDKESDDELRVRVLDSYKDISNGTNSEYYKRLAQSVDGVYSSGVYARARGTGTVNVYIASKGKSATEETLQNVQKLMDISRELNVDVKVYNANKLSVQIYIELEVEEGYDFEELSISLRKKLSDYINSLGIGKAVLLKDLGEIIYHTDGVKNYSFLSSSMDVIPTQYEYAYPFNIMFRQVQ